MKCRETLDILCDKKIVIMLKGELYKTLLMPVIIYRSKCWSVNRKIKQDEYNKDENIKVEE